MTAVDLAPVIGDESEDTPRVMRSPRSCPDTAFRVVLLGCAAVVVVLIFAIILFLAQKAWPVLHTSGLSFFTTSLWEPGTPGTYGILGDLLGTVTVAIVALVVAFPISLATALAINEYVPGGAARPDHARRSPRRRTEPCLWPLGSNRLRRLAHRAVDMVEQVRRLLPALPAGTGQGRALTIRVRTCGGDHGHTHHHLGEPGSNVADAP